MGLTDDRIRRDLCLVLSHRAEQIAWAHYEPGDWTRWAEMAESERIAPLIYWNLEREGAGWPIEMPADVRLGILQSYYSTAAHNAMLFRELARILETLAGADIPVVALKGAALAATIYPDAALRPMGDLDLLVPLETIPVAVALIEQLGFSSVQELAPHHSRAIGHHASFYKDLNRQIAVEIHWSLLRSVLDARSPSTQWLWERVQPKQVVNVWLFDAEEPLEIQVLSPEASLLYLSSHTLIQHNIASSPLVWFHDIHQSIRHWGADLDWEELLAQAKVLGWHAALVAALLVTESLFETGIPAVVRASIDARCEQDITRLLDATKATSRTNTSVFWTQWRNLNWQGRVALTSAFLFPTPAFIVQRYQPKPRWTWPLYYGYRWFTAVQDALHTVLRRRARFGLGT
jgi:hypothetical protein